MKARVWVLMVLAAPRVWAGGTRALPAPSTTANSESEVPPLPTRPNDAVARAQFLDRLGDRQGALELLAATVQGTPGDTRARLMYGKLLLWEDKDAAPVLMLIPPQAMEYEEASWLRIRLMHRDPLSARALADEVLTNLGTRSSARIKVERARAHLQLGAFEQAEADLHDAPDSEETTRLRTVLATARTQQEAIVAARGQRWTLQSPYDAIHATLPQMQALERLKASCVPVMDHVHYPRVDVLEFARAQAKRGDRASALEVLAWHLEAHPKDSDARTLRATILSWAGNYRASHEEFGKVLTTSPGHGDAAPAAVRLELWNEHPKEADAIATQALSAHPDDLELHVLRAKARKELKDYEGAKRDAAFVLAKDPNHADAQDLMRDIGTLTRLWAVGTTYTFTAFNAGQKAWHELVLQGKRETSLGSMYARAYRAWRFDSTDNQFELEAFPRLRDGTYIDVAGAFSPYADLFPKYRFQIDLYQSLPFGLEASVGYRRLRFGSKVDIGVLTLSKYLGSFFVTLRTFLTATETVSGTVHVSARRYFWNDTSYVGLRLGHGLSREELRSVNDTVLLASNTLAPEVSFRTFDRLDLGLRGAISQEARANRGDLWQYDITASAQFQF